jgi:hypothetical protein
MDRYGQSYIKFNAQYQILRNVAYSFGNETCERTGRQIRLLYYALIFELQANNAEKIYLKIKSSQKIK